MLFHSATGDFLPATYLPSFLYGSEQLMSLDSPKRTIAVVCRTIPPYRLHELKRIATELPECRLITANTHVDRWRDWSVELTPELGVTDFSNGDATNTSWIREYKRGGKVIELLERDKVDAVISGGYNDFGRLRIMRWCRRNNVPFFVFADGNINSDKGAQKGLKGFIKPLIVGNIIRQCTGFFSCGSLGRAFWEHYGADPETIFYMPYEPDYRQIQELTPDSIREAMARLGFDPHRRRIVFSGRLVPVKRVDLLVQAFSQLAQERPDWDLVILGDGVLKEELQSLVPKELADRVLWTGFLNDQADVSKVYRASDVLCLPSNYEPWALVINEAAAAGMAIVSTDVVGAAAELVRDGVNGYVVPTDNLDKLREALLKVTDSEKIDSLKKASAEVLADWRDRGDPIKGLKSALKRVGVL